MVDSSKHGFMVDIVGWADKRTCFWRVLQARNARDCHVDIGELLGMAKISGAWPSILTQPRELGKLRRNL